MRKVEAPVTSSPASSACCTGAAPRQAGSSEKCRLTQPCRGMSSAARGNSAPYATTGQQSGASRAAGRGTPGRAAGGRQDSTPARRELPRPARRQRAPAAGGRVGPGDDGDDLVAVAAAAPAGSAAAAAGVPAKTSLRRAALRPAEQRVRAHLDHRRGLADPLGLPDRRHAPPSGLGVEPVDEEDAVEVVGLVLEAAGQWRCPRSATGSPYMFSPCATTRSRREVEGQAGQRQAALVAFLLLAGKGRAPG